MIRSLFCTSLIAVLLITTYDAVAQTTTVRRLVLEDTARTESLYNTVTLRKPTAGSSYSLTLPPELLSASQQVLVADTFGVMRSINFPTPGAYLMTNAAGRIVTAVDSQSVNGTWHYIGNGGSQYPTYTLGTTSNNPFQLMANNYNAMRLTGGSAPKIGFHANNASFGGGRQGEPNVNAIGGAANSAPVADSCAVLGGWSNRNDATRSNVALGGYDNTLENSNTDDPQNSVSIAGRTNRSATGGTGASPPPYTRTMLGGYAVNGRAPRSSTPGASIGGYASSVAGNSTMLGGLNNNPGVAFGPFMSLIGSEGTGTLALEAYSQAPTWYNSALVASSSQCVQLDQTAFGGCGWSMTAHVATVGNRFSHVIGNRHLNNVSAIGSTRDTLIGQTACAIGSQDISSFGVVPENVVANSAAVIASRGGNSRLEGSRMLSLAAINRTGNTFCGGPANDPFDEIVVIASSNADLLNNRCQNTVTGGTTTMLASANSLSYGGTSSLIVACNNISAAPISFNGGVRHIVIAGGSGHTASGTSYGSIVGGQGHVTSGTPTASVVLGGRNASFTAARSWTFSAAPAAVSATASIFSLFDADVFTTPSGAMPTPAVHFFEPSTSGTQSTALQTAAQTQDITYTLPSAAPSANGSVLVAQTNGTLSWRANVPQPFVGRIATNGAAAQVIAVAGKAADAQVVVTYEGPDANVVETWVNQNIAGSFQVNYTVALPAGSFVNYQVIP